MIQKFLRFAAVGAVATAIHYALLVAFVELLDVQVLVATTIGFGVSAVANYLLNFHFTFPAHGNPHARSVVRFIAVAAAGLVLNWLAMRLLTHGLEIQYLVSQLMTTGVVLVWNFFGNALWSFATPAPIEWEVVE